MKAEEAKALGLAYEVTSVEELDEVTMNFARKLAAGSLISYKNIKKQIYDACYTDYKKWLDETEVPTQRECQTDNKGRNDTANRTDDNTRDTTKLHTDKSGRIDRNGPGCHFGNCNEIAELFQCHELLNIDDLILNQRDCSITAAYTEKTDLNKG